MSSVKAKYQASLEAIQYQGSTSMLKHDLTFAMQNLIESGKPEQAFLDSLNLNAIVKKHTGLNVEFKLVGEVNAYALPPILDLNSPLLAGFRAHGVGQDDLAPLHMGQNKVKAFSDSLKGSIDRANGKVTGVFSKIITTVSIGSGLWTEANLSAGEVAAVVLHELGHVFSFFETLTQVATTNMVLSSAVQALSKTTKKEERLQLVFGVAETMGVKIENPEALAEPTTKPETFASVFLKSYMEQQLRATHDSSRYDLRSAEFLADQFAARYGAGRDLVTGLDRMMRYAGGSHRRHFATYMIFEAFKIGVTMLGAVFSPFVWIPLVLLYLTLAPVEDKIYDDPAERLARIKNDLVQSVKDTTLDPKVRTEILDDIETIDKVREGVKDRRSVANYLWIAMTSKRREQYSQMRVQQELERLVNNDMFVRAAQLKNLV